MRKSARRGGLLGVCVAVAVAVCVLDVGGRKGRKEGKGRVCG